MLKMKEIWPLFKVAISEWQKDKAVRLGASLSFYTVFSLPPLLVIAVAIAGIYYGEEASRGQIVEQFRGLLGGQGAQMIQTMILQAGSLKTGIIATFVGVVVLLIGATAVFVDLQDALNLVWKVKPKPKSSLIDLVKIRALSLLVALGTGFLLLVSLIVSTLISAFGHHLNQLWSGPPILQYLLHGVDILLSLGMITVLFAMLYKVLPDVEIAWKDVGLGAAFTALFFTLGKFLIGLYLGRSRTASIFGAAGALAILLLWIYYYSQAFFFGAEFTRVFANSYGSKIKPKEYAQASGPQKTAPEPHLQGR